MSVSDDPITLAHSLLCLQIPRNSQREPPRRADFALGQGIVVLEDIVDPEIELQSSHPAGHESVYQIDWQQVAPALGE